MTFPVGEAMTIAVRAYASKIDAITYTKPSQAPTRKTPSPSEWTLIFDTETTTDPAQTLRFGTYQVRKNGELEESGFFYNPDAMRTDELERLHDYAISHGLRCITVREFVDDIFYGVGYAYRATIVGFNLPFDISRLALDHAPARSSKHNKIMRGGFTFKLSENPDFPRVQIKNISSRDAFIQFAAPRGQRTSRGCRKKKRFQSVRRGFFMDAKTFAAALTSQSHTLASLAKALGVSAQKHDTEEHGRSLTNAYIEYALQDSQTTWECIDRLKSLYAMHGLTLTETHKIHSEASIGKAYLREMGVQPWRKLQPDFPENLLGSIMSAYYGGRSEVHIRKTSVQVLYCDFLSMYPTVCTLMGLWRFVTAHGMQWADSTEATRQFIDTATIDDLQQQDTWRKLTTLVQVLPEDDIFPVRAKYGGDAQYTIGTNYVTSPTPLWYTLADCLASKMLTGHAPKIVQAITFEPKGLQDGLRSVCVAGNSDYAVNPTEGDFFKRVIDLRREVKEKLKVCAPEEKSRLASQQLALKILANATSYGIFVELNVEEDKSAQPVRCYGHSGQPIHLQMKKFEAPGLFFHPLLAALITGAARLMLAITERLARDHGLDWAFCDTDSMALAKPTGMSQETFYEKARTVQEWFTPLNPYTRKSALFKIEDENYSQSDASILEPLYCYAVSSKRYALFNLDAKGRPRLRKASEHGLGHLLPPYEGERSDQTGGAKAWQADLWLEIIQAALKERHPDYSQFPNFQAPAVSRYGATTPPLLKWFKVFNQDKPYKEQVKPFNFLLALLPKHNCKPLKPVSSFVKDITQASAQCFDRETGEPIGADKLKTYQEALAQYHLHPETKFLNGDYLDQGKTDRRRVVVQSIQYIGKEANKWEEQYFTGLDEDAQIVYGASSESLGVIMRSIKKYGIRKMARAAKVSERQVHNIYHGKAIASEKALTKLLRAAAALDSTSASAQKLCKLIRSLLREKGVSVRQLSAQLGIDPSNLSKMLSGSRGCLAQLDEIYSAFKGAS